MAQQKQVVLEACIRPAAGGFGEYTIEPHGWEPTRCSTLRGWRRGLASAVRRPDVEGRVQGMGAGQVWEVVVANGMEPELYGIYIEAVLRLDATIQTVGHGSNVRWERAVEWWGAEHPAEVAGLYAAIQACDAAAAALEASAEDGDDAQRTALNAALDAAIRDLTAAEGPVKRAICIAYQHDDVELGDEMASTVEISLDVAPADR